MGKKTKANSIARSGTTAGKSTRKAIKNRSQSPVAGQATIGNSWGKTCSGNANLKKGTGAASAG